MGEIEETELETFITSDGELYRQRHQPILKNLTLKKYKGIYDRKKAEKAMGYLVDDGAKKYVQENGSPDDKWNEMFDIETRKAVAKDLTDIFETEHGYGNYSNFLPKYAQKGNNFKSERQRKFVMAKLKGGRH